MVPTSDPPSSILVCFPFLLRPVLRQGRTPRLSTSDGRSRRTSFRPGRPSGPGLGPGTEAPRSLWKSPVGSVVHRCWRGPKSTSPSSYHRRGPSPRITPPSPPTTGLGGPTDPFVGPGRGVRSVERVRSLSPPVTRGPSQSRGPRVGNEESVGQVLPLTLGIPSPPTLRPYHFEGSRPPTPTLDRT